MNSERDRSTYGKPITVYSDHVCPFCYLGRRSLSQYQATREERLAIDWHPFDLRAGKRGPDGEINHTVDDGKDDAYYEQAKKNVRRLQEQYNVDMTHEIATDIDSLPAQLASVHVQSEHPDRWLDFDEAIFEALWQSGRDIGDPDVLSELAADSGIDPGEIRTATRDETLRGQLHSQFAEARKRGITGVPTFEYDGQRARGAVPPEQLKQLVEGTD